MEMLDEDSTMVVDDIVLVVLKKYYKNVIEIFFSSNQMIAITFVYNVILPLDLFREIKYVFEFYS